MTDGSQIHKHKRGHKVLHFESSQRDVYHRFLENSRLLKKRYENKLQTSRLNVTLHSRKYAKNQLIPQNQELRKNIIKLAMNITRIFC